MNHFILPFCERLVDFSRHWIVTCIHDFIVTKNRQYGFQWLYDLWHAMEYIWRFTFVDSGVGALVYNSCKLFAIRLLVTRLCQNVRLYLLLWQIFLHWIFKECSSIFCGGFDCSFWEQIDIHFIFKCKWWTFESDLSTDCGVGLRIWW